jgi:hypothetical protein
MPAVRPDLGKWLLGSSRLRRRTAEMDRNPRSTTVVRTPSDRNEDWSVAPHACRWPIRQSYRPECLINPLGACQIPIRMQTSPCLDAEVRIDIQNASCSRARLIHEAEAHTGGSKPNKGRTPARCAPSTFSQRGERGPIVTEHDVAVPDPAEQHWREEGIQPASIVEKRLKHSAGGLRSTRHFRRNAVQNWD